MRLLFINQSLGIGGAETFNKELLLWLQNHDVSVKTFVTNEIFQKILEGVDIHSGHIPIVVDIIGNRKGFIKGLLFLPLAFLYYFFLVLKNRNSDIILMSGFIEKIVVTPIAKLFKIPVIWIEFAPLNTIFDKFFHLPKYLYQLVLNIPSNIIVPSEYTSAKLSNELNIMKNRFTHIPCARIIELSNYSHIKTENNLVCCVSRLEQGKGQDLLLKAWSLVEKEIPKARLTIIGEGDFIKDLIKIKNNFSLKKTDFKGYVNDALAEIAKSEIFVFPTVWPLEGFGLVAVEAMALEKPIVCFNFGPVPEIVDSKSGIIVEEKNTEQMAEAIIQLLKNKKLSGKLGREGRKKYLKNFTFAKIGPKYLSLFNKIV